MKADPEIRLKRVYVQFCDVGTKCAHPKTCRTRELLSLRATEKRVVMGTHVHRTPMGFVHPQRIISNVLNFTRLAAIYIKFGELTGPVCVSPMADRIRVSGALVSAHSSIVLGCVYLIVFVQRLNIQ